MSSKESVLLAIQGSHTVFGVTQFWEKFSHDQEVQDGKNLADASKTAGVKHLIFSSTISMKKASNGALTHVYHFDSKAAVADYIRSIGVPATFVLAGTYASNFAEMLRQPEPGKFQMFIPAGDDMRYPVIDCKADYGRFPRAYWHSEY